MLRHELYSMIHDPRLKDEYAAELFLGFRIGTVCSCHFAVLPVQGQGGLLRLKRFSTSPVPVGAKMVVVFKACVEHGALFGSKARGLDSHSPSADWIANRAAVQRKIVWKWI